MSAPDPYLLDIPDELTTERLLLRAFQAGDGAPCFEAIEESRDHLHPFMFLATNVQDAEEAERLARKAYIQFLEREAFRFAIRRREDGLFLGTCALHYADWAVPKFELGCWIRASQARNGYATEAIEALIAFGFDTLGAQRLEVRCDHRNTATQQGALKNGFVMEARLRHHNRALDGELVDEIVFALLRDEIDHTTE